MTKLLLKLFIKKDLNSQEGRSKAGSLSGIVGIISNIILFTAKIIIGTLSGSVAITADAVNNLTDASSSIVTLIGFKLSEKPADEEHPYGHARFEYLSGLAVAAMIGLIGFELLKSSVLKVLTPEATLFNIPMAIVLLLSVGVKLWLSLFNNFLGKKINSSALLATAADSRNDAISTTAVLIAALVEYFTSWQIDGYVGILVAIFILYSAWNLAKDTISPLLGEAVSEEMQDEISSLLREFPMVLNFHDLMVHDYGPGQRFASVHVEMDKREDPLVCHELIDNIERLALDKLKTHLVIHYDPVTVDDIVLNGYKAEAENILASIDQRLHLHDFRMVECDCHTNLIFDVSLPYDLKGKETEIKSAIQSGMCEKHGKKFYAVITFDPASFNTK
ncbi:MAG: cation transporter [Ruminococcaceae bacterium]|nr:cation transporter [Oscillospiraceae bacterium]